MFQVLGLYENGSYYQMVMQKCPGITLFDLVELNTGIQEDMARIVYTQVYTVKGTKRVLQRMNYQYRKL